MDEAGTRLLELLVEAADGLVPITRDDRTVAFLITPERLEELRETWEILANPEALEAIQRDRAGKGVYYTLEEMDAIFGPLDDEAGV